MKLWIGKEKEGKHIGMYTLFVCGNEITFIEIEKVLDEHLAIKQIYFGAGLCSAYNIEIVKKCCNVYKNMIITVEIRLDDLKKFSTYLLHKDNLHIIITFDDEHKRLIHLNPLNVQFKLQCLKRTGRMIAMSSLENFNLVDIIKLKKKIYKGDKVLKRL